jgi:hypothetical protein
MPRLALISLLPLAACAAAEPQMLGVTPGHKCQAAGTAHFLGQSATDKLARAIIRETHAAILRWSPPGVMLTMDYREDRVTVRLGPDRKVMALNCG